MAEKTSEEKRADYAKRAAKAEETRRRKAEEAQRTMLAEGSVAVAEEPIEINADTEVDIYANLELRPGDHVYLTVRSSPDLTIGTVTLSNRNNEDRQCTIPKTVSLRDMYKWNNALRLRIVTKGTLELDKNGKVIPRPIDKAKKDKRDQNALHACLDYIEDYDRLRDMGIGLSRIGTHVSGWHPKDLLQEVRDYESKHSNRRQMLDFLDRAIEAVGHVSFVNVPLDPEVHLRAALHYDARILPHRPKRR